MPSPLPLISRGLLEMAEPDERELNNAAVLALLGLHKAPEKAIADLLSSNFELSPKFRAQLANAFMGRDGPVSLRLRGMSSMKIARRSRYWRGCIERGQAVEDLISKGETYERAVEAVAKRKDSPGKKSVENDLTIARKADRWAQGRPGSGLVFSRQLKNAVFAQVLANLGRRADEATLFKAADIELDWIIEATEAGHAHQPEDPQPPDLMA